MGWGSGRVSAVTRAVTLEMPLSPLGPGLRSGKQAHPQAGPVTPGARGPGPPGVGHKPL